MKSLIDFLFITSVIFFILGVLGIFVKSLRKKFRLRYYFITSLFCFSVSLALGWEDAVKAFKDGVNDARTISSDTEQVDD